MATRSVELYTLAAGEVDSMAIPIFLSGKKRLIAPTSSIFFHEIGRTFSKDVRYSTSELHRLATDMTESEQAYATFIASRCNMWRPEDVLDAMRAERKLKAEEAVKLGIAHAILNQSNIPF
jgi:ATP-dependent protease ClpP protease subunit